MHPRVALINPPREKGLFTPEQRTLCRNRVVQIDGEVSYPLEFGYITSTMKAQGCEVGIWDGHNWGLSREEIVEGLKAFSPSVIGIPTEVSSNFRCPIPFYPHVVRMVEAIRGAGIGTRIVVWGPHGTVFPRQVLQDTGADVVIKGEVEETFPRVVLSWDLGEVGGIAYRQGAELVETGDAPPVDLDSLPIPDYDALQVGRYYHPLFGKEKFFLAMGSRGCPYRCSYCAKEMQGGYRARPVPKILDELKALKARGVTHISFTDETFTLKKTRVLELCREMVSRGLGMRWTCQTRAELLDDELMGAMKEAGCTWIGVGFESASEEVRERAGKQIMLGDVRRAVELGKQHGVTVNLFMISFLPGETYATLDESLEFVRQEKPPLLSTVIATPIPGTRLWEEGLASGALERGDWEECLRKAGQIGTGFTAEEIEEYSRVYTAELSLYGGLIGYKLKALLGNPTVLPHFFSMLLFYIRYRMKKLYKGRGKGGREAKA